MRAYSIILYGAYGYTGRLIAHECRAKGLGVLLAGRNREKLEALSNATGFPFEVVAISDGQHLRALLAKGHLVIHCAGPFRFTSRQMVEACLETKTHYTDITGEFDVLERMAGYDAAAKEANIVLLPGVGFDVVPSDCLAVYLKDQLPSASHLKLAFAMSGGGPSRGTAKTMIHGLGYGGMIRKDGVLTPIALGQKSMTVNFGPFTRTTLCIPWGDISTSWRSTGIPNIEVYMALPLWAIRFAKLSRWFNVLLRARWVKRILLKQIDHKKDGPASEKIQHGKSHLWGKVMDDKGNKLEARLETASGYLLTARSAVYIAKQLLSEPVRPGYFTPAQYFGATLILQIEGSRLHATA